MHILQHLSWIFQNTPIFSLSDGFQSSYGHVFWDHTFFWSTLYIDNVDIYKDTKMITSILLNSNSHWHPYRLFHNSATIVCLHCQSSVDRYNEYFGHHDIEFWNFGNGKIGLDRIEGDKQSHCNIIHKKKLYVQLASLILTRHINHYILKALLHYVCTSSTSSRTSGLGATVTMAW